MRVENSLVFRKGVILVAQACVLVVTMVRAKRLICLPFGGYRRVKRENSPLRADGSDDAEVDKSALRAWLGQVPMGMFRSRCEAFA